MRPDGTGQSGPVIPRVWAKIQTLERRADHLRRRLDEGRGNERTMDFDRSELDALSAACVALRYHAAALYAETDPVLALAELADAIEGDDDDRIDSAIARAQRILRELHADD